MALPITPNVVVPNPEVVWFFDLYLPSGTLRLSYGDEYAPAALGGYFYHRRLLTVPRYQERLPRDEEAVDPPIAFTLDVSLVDGVLDEFFTVDIRNAPVIGHLWERTHDLLKANAVIGTLAGGTQSEDYQALSLVVTVDPLKLDNATWPPFKITATAHPDSPEKPPMPSGGLGSTVAYPFGLSLSVPCRLARVQKPTTEAGCDFIVAWGNVGVCRLSIGEGTRPMRQGVDYDVYLRLYEITGYPGRYATAVRLFNGLPRDSGSQLLPLVTDIEACYPPITADDVAQWKFKSSLKDDLVSYHARFGHDTFGTTDLTTGDYVAGPSGFYLGGLRFDESVPHGYVEAPGVPTAEDFSVTFWIKPPLPGQTTAWWGVLHGPGGLWDGTDPGSWAVMLNGAINRLMILARSTSDTQLTEKLTVDNFWTPGDDVWRLVHVRRHGSAWEVYVDGSLTPADASSEGADVVYPGQGPMLLGVCGAATQGSPQHFRGTLGPVTYATGTAHVAAWAHDYWLRMQRNPARGARIMIEDMGLASDGTTFDALEEAFQVLKLKADLCLTEPVPRQTALANWSAFRRMHFYLKSTFETRVVALTTAPTTVDATFGVGDPIYANAGLLERSRRSVAEAISKLIVKYRAGRTGTGAFDKFIGELPARDVVSTGRSEVTRELSYVHDHWTADDYADFESKYLQMEDEVVRIATDMAAWPVTPGGVVRIILPVPSRAGLQRSTSIGFKPASPTMVGFKPAGPEQVGFKPALAEDVELVTGDYYVQAVGAVGATHDLEAIPYTETLFTRSPGTLPADSLIDTSAHLNLGNNQLITYSYLNIADRRISATFVMLEQQAFPPAEQTVLEDYTVVGADTAVEAVSPAGSTDSYLQTTSGDFQAFGATYPPVPATHNVAFIRSVRVTVLASQSGAGGDVLITLRSGLVFIAAQLFTITLGAGEMQTFSMTVEHPDPADPNRAWIRDDLQQLSAVISARSSTGGSEWVRLHTISIDVVQQAAKPDDLRLYRWWRVGPDTSENPPTPPPPSEQDEPFRETYSPYLEVDFTEPGPGHYWFWIGCYDTLARLTTPEAGPYRSGGPGFQNGMIGPFHIDIP